LLLGAGLVFLLSSGVFYYLYADLKIKNQVFSEKMAAAEKRIDFLITEKELLLARLVISGEKPDQFIASETMQDEKQAKILQEKDSQAPPLEEMAEKLPDSGQDPVGEKSSSPETPKTGISEPADHDQKAVDLENFQVSRDRQNEDLLVRFDIRNVSEQSGDVSGYIFTVLRSEKQNTDNWLVVPATELENGIPQMYQKGQYFSISRFKPVKFRIKKQSSPDILTKASIFVFDNKGSLIFNSLIDITDDDQG
jgi:hypothetical protein